MQVWAGTRGAGCFLPRMRDGESGEAPLTESEVGQSGVVQIIHDGDLPR